MSDFFEHTTEPSGAKITEEDFHRMLEEIYQSGGSPDLVYIDEEGIDRLYRMGVLTRREYLWLKLRIRVGRWTRSVNSGVRSVLRTLGLGRTGSP